VKALTVLLLGWGIAVSGWSLSVEEIQTAIDLTPKGQILVLPPGTYQGHLVLRKPISLRAHPGTKIFHPLGTPGPTLSIESSDVEVDGLVVEGSGEGTRRDHTAVVVSGRRVTLSGLRIERAWSGVWVDQGDTVTLDNLTVIGLTDFPFWQRGEGVRITKGTNVRLQGVQLTSVADGVYVERSTNIEVKDLFVHDARYGLHLMFSTRGEACGIRTSRTVAGVMVMESSHWVVRDSHFVDGYRTGSAGVREIRTKAVTILRTEVARQASGIELLDARDGRFQDNQVTENGVAWTWGGDNAGTLVQDNNHRGNLLDFAGTEPTERTLVGTEAHNHGAAPKLAPTVEATGLHTRPQFDRNYWDAWTGTDLDRDGLGDTPYRFDSASAIRAATQPWAGVFLGSPWSQWSRTVPGGEVIDAHPRTKGFPP